MSSSVSIHIAGNAQSTLADRNVCSDGHACENDSTCVESLFNERKFVCDCSDALIVKGHAYAGLSCQHVATEYCTTDGPGVVNSVAFCVNEGTCKSTVNTNDDAPHPGCNCPKGYSGSHCQYIAGSEPSTISYFVDGTTTSDFTYPWLLPQGGPGIPPAAFVVPLVLGAVVVAGLMLWKCKRHGVLHTIDRAAKADANMLEADGSALASARAKDTPYKRNSTPAFASSDLLEPPDFDDLLATSDHVHNASNGSSSTSLAVYNRSFKKNMAKEVLEHAMRSRGYSSGEEEDVVLEDVEGGMTDVIDEILAAHMPSDSFEYNSYDADKNTEQL